MKNFNAKSLEILQTGIKQLLLESRCSFSEEEIVLLNDCILALQEKNCKSDCVDEDLGPLIKVVEVIIKVCIASEHLKHLF